MMFNSFLSLFMSLDSDSYTVIITAESVLDLNQVKNDRKFFKMEKNILNLVSKILSILQNF